MVNKLRGPVAENDPILKDLFNDTMSRLPLRTGGLEYGLTSWPAIVAAESSSFDGGWGGGEGENDIGER